MKMRTEYTCPLELVHDMIKGKWKPIILWRLRLGATSLAKLERDIDGITQKMLLEQLKELMDYGFVEKRSYEGYLLHVEEDIKKHGQSFTHELPVEEIVNYIKGLPNWNVQMLSLTHDCKNENNVAEFVSRFSHPSILSDEIDKRDIAPLCYGAAMFLCALTEKLLRMFYIYLMRDRVYVPLTSATLGTLLSPDNQEMVNIFGKDHLKSLSFLFCTVGDKKIGMNYRNNLAHWIGLRDRDINSMLVAKLFFLYTDVINTIFWYFCKEGWDELE